MNDRPVAGAEAQPRGTLRFFLQLLAGVAVIAIGVTAIFLLTGGERAVVRKYVTLLRENKTSEAYDMLAAARKNEFSADAFPLKLHTAILAKSTDLTIAASGRSSRGKGCVTAFLDDLGYKSAVYFYILDEAGQKRIHSVFTSEDFAAGGLVALEPWHCE